MEGRDIGIVGSVVSIIVVAIGGGIWIGQTQATAEELKRQVLELKQGQKDLRKRQDVIHLIRTDQGLIGSAGG